MMWTKILRRTSSPTPRGRALRPGRRQRRSRFFSHFLPLSEWQTLPVVSGLVRYFRGLRRRKWQRPVPRNTVYLTSLLPRLERLEERRVLSGGGLSAGYDPAAIVLSGAFFPLPQDVTVPDPTVQVGQLGMTAHRGDIVHAWVHITENTDLVNGLLSADLTISYNTGVVNLTYGGDPGYSHITLSPYLVSRSWGMARNVPSPETGTAFVSVYSTSTPLTPGDTPDLFDLAFRVKDDAPLGTTTLQISGGRLNEGRMVMTTLNGSINVVGPDAVFPTVSPSSINENGSTTLTGSFVDPGAPGQHTVAINWGDGGTSNLTLGPGVTTFPATPHQYLNEPGTSQPSGTYPIGVTVTGGPASLFGGANVTVNNVPPSNLLTTVTPAAPITGTTITLSESFSDPGTQDPHTVVINWGDSSPPTTLSLPAGVLTDSATHLYGQPGTYTIHKTVTDEDGANTSADVTVNVGSVSPGSVTVSPIPDVINENDTIKLEGNFNDPAPPGLHTVVVEWGDGSTNTTLSPLAPGVTAFNAGFHWYANEPGSNQVSGYYTITVSVTGAAGTSYGTARVLVNNVPPADVTLTMSPSSINENQTALLSGGFTDPGVQDPHMVTINWGDGSSNALLTLTLAPGVRTFTAGPHQYLNEPGTTEPTGPYTISMSVGDEDNESASGTTTLTVNNVAPSGLTAIPSGGIPGANLTTLSGAFVDPGTRDTHTVTINWGDGSSNSLSTVTLSAGVLTYSAAHQYASATTPYTASVTVVDDDNATASTTAIVCVNNLAPQVSCVKQPCLAAVRQTVTIRANFTDPDSINRHTATIDWGDRTSQTVPVLEKNGAGTITASHVYGARGNYVITVTVTDNGGASGVATKKILIVAAPLSSSSSVVKPLTWSGLAGDGKWSNPKNWTGNVAPQPGDSLSFANRTGLPLVNDYPDGMVFNSISLLGSNVVLTGNPVVIGYKGGVALRNTSGNNTLALPITLAGDVTFLDAAGQLTINGPIDTAGYVLTFENDSTQAATINGVISGTGSLVKTGTGALNLTASNTLTGPITVVAGALYQATTAPAAALLSTAPTPTPAPGQPPNSSPALAPGPAVGTATTKKTSTVSTAVTPSTPAASLATSKKRLPVGTKSTKVSTASPVANPKNTVAT